MNQPKPHLSRSDKVSYLLCFLVYGTLFATHYAGAPWLVAGLLSLTAEETVQAVRLTAETLPEPWGML